MLWQQTLKELSIPEDQLSVRLKKSISSYREMEAAIENAELSLTDEKLPAGKKKKFEKAAGELKQDLETLDKTLSDGIKKYHKNKDVYDIRTAALLKSREDKKQGQAAEPVTVKTESDSAGTIKTVTIEYNGSSIGNNITEQSEGKNVNVIPEENGHPAAVNSEPEPEQHRTEIHAQENHMQPEPERVNVVKAYQNFPREGEEKKRKVSTYIIWAGLAILSLGTVTRAVGK